MTRIVPARAFGKRAGESAKRHVEPPPEIDTNVGTEDQQHVNATHPRDPGHPRR
jgi:hypothetical protein